MLPAAESIEVIVPIASIVLLLLGLKRPVYGVVSYLFISCSKLGEMYPAFGAMRFEVIAAVVVCISIAISGVDASRVSPKRNEINRSLWILFVVGILSVLQSVDIVISWKNGGYELFKMVLFYAMVICAVNSRSDAKILVWGVVVVTAWIAYEPTVNYLRGVVIEEEYGAVAIGRFGAASGHVALANTINQGIPLAVSLALYEKKKSRSLLLWGLIALMIAGVIFTKSRGGFLGLLVIGIGEVYFAKNRGRAVALFVTIFLVSLPVFGRGYYEHISSISKGMEIGRSAEDRYMGLINGIEMMIKRPLLGVGIGCYEEARSQYFKYRFYAHNLYGELFGELGIGSAVWFWWIYSIFVKAVRIRKILDVKDEKQSFYAALLNAIILGLSLRLIIGNFTHGWFIWFWFLMAALTVCIDRLVQETGPREELLMRPKLNRHYASIS